MTTIVTDHYQTLGISTNATSREIKSAYRELVKKHHPDTGGSKELILQINAAWEILGDIERRNAYDQSRRNITAIHNEAKKRGVRNARASDAAKATHMQTAVIEKDLLHWLKDVYTPIDRLLGQIINPFEQEVKNLSADPYDDLLMDTFLLYLEGSKKRIDKINSIYHSRSTPAIANSFGLDLYHCLSQVEDALDELERYTLGYVDNYLHDGREMLREAKKKRMLLKATRNRLKIS